MSASASAVLLPTETAYKEVGIFISHKHEDSRAAKLIQSKFEQWGGDRLKVYLSELVPKGEEWDPKIHEWLRQSDWLLLLYTGPGVEWDWCLYETGFFAGSHETTAKRFCLHRAGVELPGPLKAWQSATEEDCAELLDQIFRQEPFPGGKPLHLRLNDETLKTVAAEIMEAVGEKAKPVVFPPYVELQMEKPHQQELRTSGTLAGDIRVVFECNAHEVFGLLDGMGGRGLTWADVAGQLERTRQKGWVNSLSDSLRRVCQNQSVSTTLPIVYSVTDDAKTRWRPILYSVQTDGETQVFRIVLSEIRPEDDPRPSDPSLDHCMTLITTARMFRYGVIEKYRPLVRQLQTRKRAGTAVTAQDLEPFDALPSAIDRIETEAMNSGVRNLDVVIDLFPDPDGEESKKLGDWSVQWAEYRKQLMGAVATKNLDEMEKALDGMRNINRDCFRLMAHRYCEMIDALK
ncbi:MAG TPA: toll/interleukin-1 receptor domain-containing protein [Bryobacteraceae bacterium]|jgi:hypothetical protein